jgi:hypothetical protein
VQEKEVRLQKIQHLAHEIMYEINSLEDQRQFEDLRVVVDNLSRAIGEFADPYGCFSLDYIEDKLEKSHSIIKKHRIPHIGTQGKI